MLINLLLVVISPYTAFLPVFIIAFKTLYKKDTIYFKNPWNSGLLILFFWSLFVGIANSNTISASASFILLLYFFVSIYIQNNYNNEENIETLLKYIIIFTVASSFIGIFEKVSVIYFDSIWWGPIFGIPAHPAVREDYRIYSTFGNPNMAGAWFATAILICLNFFDSSKGLKKVLYLAPIILFVCSLILTGSRGGALGLELGLTVYAYLRKDRNTLILVSIIFISVMLIMIIPPGMIFGISAVNESMNHSVVYSVDGRQAIWRSCFNMFKMKPLTGWGLLGIYFAKGDIFLYHHREFHGHNIWISLTTTLGIIGLGVYFYIKAYLVESIRLLHSNSCRLVPLLAGIQSIIIGQGLVDFTIMTPQGGIIFFICSSFISSLAMQYGSSRAEEYPIPFQPGRKGTAKFNL